MPGHSDQHRLHSINERLLPRQRIRPELSKLAEIGTQSVDCFFCSSQLGQMCFKMEARADTSERFEPVGMFTGNCSIRKDLPEEPLDFLLCWCDRQRLLERAA